MLPIYVLSPDKNYEIKLKLNCCEACPDVHSL